MEEMTPAEIDAIFDASIVRNLDDAPQALVNRTRERTLRKIERTEAAPQP